MCAPLWAIHSHQTVYVRLFCMTESGMWFIRISGLEWACCVCPCCACKFFQRIDSRWPATESPPLNTTLGLGLRLGLGLVLGLGLGFRARLGLGVGQGLRLWSGGVRIRIGERVNLGFRLELGFLPNFQTCWNFVFFPFFHVKTQ